MLTWNGRQHCGSKIHGVLVVNETMNDLKNDIVTLAKNARGASPCDVPTTGVPSCGVLFVQFRCGEIAEVVGKENLAEKCEIAVPKEGGGDLLCFVN